MRTTGNTVPPYISSALVAAACEISWKSARSLLKRAGILELTGGRWYVGESRLRERLPEVYDRVYAYVVLNSPKPPEIARDRPKRPGGGALIEGEG